MIRYRAKSAARDVGRALGLGEDQLTSLPPSMPGRTLRRPADRLRERGFDPDSAVMRRLIVLVDQLVDFPRHLSQHVGGFVISEHPLHALVPVENAAMPERTIIQWDKDDLEYMTLLKVDCLALGMLSCLRRCFDLVRRHDGRELALYSIPHDDPQTWQMIQRADTVGVCQIESRAQMSMLPRLRPASFHDLVIQIAIVRPGPIQGGMVHPYLRRRNGEEEIDSAIARRTRARRKDSRVKRSARSASIFGEGDEARSSPVSRGARRCGAARRWKRKGLEPFHDRSVRHARQGLRQA